MCSILFEKFLFVERFAQITTTKKETADGTERPTPSTIAPKI